MSVFFENLLESGGGLSAIHIDAVWHKTYAILAVSSFSNDGSGFIQFYNDEGSLTSKASLVGEGVSVRIVSIQWHPSRKILAIACEGGDIYTWNDYEQELLLSTSQHRSAISVLVWSSCGSRLVSTDSNGALVAWKVNSKGQLEVVFHHELRDPLSHVVFRTNAALSQTNTNVDVGGLARAAVSGDEQALDLFSSLQIKEKEGIRLNLSRSERRSDLSFYVATSSGAVYFVNDDGSCMEVLDSTFALHCMLYHHERNLVVVINEAPLVLQYNSKPDGSLEELSKVKFASKMSDVEAIWAGSGKLVLSVGDLSLRFWDVDNGDSYSVMMEGKHLREGLEHISTIAYNEEQRVLVAGTNLGNIHMWSRLKERMPKPDPEKQWANYGICAIKGAVKQIRWSGIPDNMAVNATTCLYMLTAQKICLCFKNQIAAVQLAPNQLVLEFTATGRHLMINSDVQIRGMQITTENVVVWSGSKVVVYEFGVEGSRTQQVGCFPCNTSKIEIYEQSLYTIESGKVQVRTFQGTIKQSLIFLETEGEVTQIDVCSSYLVTATSLNVLKIWEISRREAKPFTSPKYLPEHLHGGGTVSSLRCNCSGSKVSLLLSKDRRLIVWDVEADKFMEYDFEGSSRNDSGNSQSSNRMESKSSEVITSHYWDPEEPRLLVGEISKSQSKFASRLVSLFVTTEYGVLAQDTIDIESMTSSLLGVQVPNYYLMKQGNEEQLSILVDTVTMRDFAGLENGDTTTRDAMINFGFYLTVGNMDEAFKAINKIKSGKVWENMARMCVKTKRLDVAAVCLGNMGHACGARALREAMTEPEPDARVAALAVQLGLLVEAEELYKGCSRFDLLNRFYQASNQWQKALAVAKSDDRIHLRATYYNYAKYLETKGDISGAIANFELSETHCFEVPRMLFDELPALEHYITATKNKKLYQWWAQYMESTGEMETAIQYYEKADDYLSLVRVYCYCDNLDKAAEIANETGDRAACYHLGRRYENDGNIKAAVHFFEKAQAYNNAIRICKEHQLEDQLLNLALMGGPEEMVDVARYYEAKEDQVERAVMLYLKGGLVAKAGELAFKSGHNSVMEMLASELNEKTEPSILRRCALFFIENGHHGKAVDLLAKAKEYLEAVTLCMEYNVTLSESLVEMLTPAKEDMDTAQRSQLLEKIADGCYQQGNYHLATKKFTQAGNKIKAMKALLKSGDTERIVFFANVSRQKEIYVMAANYLQTLDWRQDSDIMKNIVAFYTKGKTPELLAGFYDACAQVEIDEFQNYNKALGALNEACKCLSTANTKRSSIVEDKLEQLRTKLDFVKRFLQARRAYEDDPSESMKMCQTLLEEHNLNIGVRPGDVYGFMIEHFAQKQNFKMAYNLIEEMRSKLPNVNLAFYVDTKTLETIKDNLNFPYNNDNNIFINNNTENARRTNPYESDDEVAEDVKEETYLHI